MTDATSDSFLKGQGIPVDPRQIEAELTRLWGPAAERVGGPAPESPTVTRVVLANLVVVGPEAEAGRIDGVLDTVVARYPCRAIVLRRTGDPDREVRAEVSALCHLPAPGLPQVCSERIVLKAGPQALDLLPGAVRSLLEADLPFILWWADDPRADGALFRILAAECSRSILDLPDPQADPAALAAGLDPARNRFGRDLAWFGISHWRELVAQFFDPPCPAGVLSRLATVRVEARAPSAERPPRAALWLVAWLAGQLGWEPDGRREAGPGSLDATFRGPSGPVAVAVRTTTDPSLRFAELSAVTLSAPGPDGPRTYRLARPEPGSAEVRVEAEAPASCAPVRPRLVHAPAFDPARRLAAALESARDDPPFRRAWPHLRWLLTGER